MVICLIADVVASRFVPDRASLQATLTEVLRHLNEGHDRLLSPYTLTLGDEFQAVFRAADGLFADLTSIQTCLYPTELRFAIGVGPLSTPLNPASALGMDGPAFHTARNGMQQLKGSRARYRVNLHERTPAWIDPVLQVVSHAVTRWPATRLQVLHYLLRGVRLAEVPGKVHLTPAAVYKSAQAGDLRNIVAILEEVERAIDAALAEP
jgi:hypothetical protein